MRQICVVFITITFALLMSTNIACAFSPDRPTLSINENEELCVPLLNAWTDVFDREGSISEVKLELEKFFSPEILIHFPKTPPYSGLYGDGYFFQADVNADDELDTFYITGNEIGWRYLGVDLYEVHGFEDLQKELPVKFEEKLPRELRDKISPSNRGIGLEYKKYFKKIRSFKPVKVLYFLRGQDGLHALTVPRDGWMPQGVTVELLKLDATEESIVCQVDLLPSRKKYKEFTEYSALFSALKDVYGGSSSRCMGTLGWTADPLDSSLTNIFERPHILFRQNKKADWRESEAATQLRYISWATSDPISWQAYKTIEKSKSEFIDYLKNYYSVYFGYNEDRAQKAAEIAVKYWLNNVIYARGSDGYHITVAAKYFDDLDGTDTKSIVNAAYDVLVTQDLGRQGEVYPDLLLALIYTRSDKDKIMSMYDNMPDPKDAQHYQNVIDTALLASIGNLELMKMSLDYGANINTETNWFKKTPLMYAAQINDYDSVKFLINHGADVNAKTDATEYRCGSLERDNRTPLMYAAENAGRDVIELLVKANADLLAKDTKGNDIDWYLDRNTTLDDENKSMKIFTETAPSRSR